MRGQLHGAKEAVFLITAASAAVLAVLRPDLCAALAHRAATAIAGLLD